MAQPKLAHGALATCARSTGSDDGMVVVLRLAGRPGKGLCMFGMARRRWWWHLLGTRKCRGKGSWRQPCCRVPTAMASVRAAVASCPLWRGATHDDKEARVVSKSGGVQGWWKTWAAWSSGRRQWWPWRLNPRVAKERGSKEGVDGKGEGPLALLHYGSRTQGHVGAR
jgi:hypothetical protein